MHLSMCLSMVSLVSSLNFLRQRGHSPTWTNSFSLVTSWLGVVVLLPTETGVSITSSAVSGWTSPPRYIELAELCLIGWVTARLAVAYEPWRNNKKDMFFSNVRNVHFVEFCHGIKTTVVTFSLAFYHLGKVFQGPFQCPLENDLSPGVTYLDEIWAHSFHVYLFEVFLVVKKASRLYALIFHSFLHLFICQRKNKHLNKL